MTIEQADKIDGMGIDRETKEFVMLISDHLTWDDRELHFSSLEKKIGGYIDFLSNGQHIEISPQDRDLPVRIKLIYEHMPPVSAEDILKSVRTQLSGMNIGFSYEALPSEY